MAALNRCIAPRSKAQIGDWYATTVLRRLLPVTAGQLTSQRFWDNMARVTPAHIAAIEQQLAGTAVARFGLALRWLLFDATNFFTFVDSFNNHATLPQRGHSKEGRDISGFWGSPSWSLPMARFRSSITPTRAISTMR